MSLEVFLAQRRSSQDTAIETLSPVVSDALADREDATTEAWVDPIVSAAVEIYLGTYADEAPPNTPAPSSTQATFRRQVREALTRASMTEVGDGREDQVQRLSLWLAVAAINAATYDALVFGDPNTAGGEWVTMRDENVRETHREVGGQQQLYGRPFNVAGHELRYPGEPVGPPEVWLGCRCSLRPVPVVQEAVVEQITAAVADHAAPDYAGGMVALKPAAPETLAVEGGDPASELHVTLAFLGDDVSAMSDGALGAIATGAQRSAEYTPVKARVAGIGRLGDEGATVMFLNGDGLSGARGALLAEMNDYGDEEFHPQYEPFIAHMTLGYELNPADYEDTIGTEFVLDRVDVHLGGEVTTYQAERAAEVEPDEELEPIPDSPVGVLPWFGVLAPEGTPSGDRREFAVDSLRWRDLPLPLTWQRASGEGHNGSVVVGQIQRIWRDGNLLKAEGVFADTPEADEVIGLLADGTLRGVSVEVDDFEAALNEDETAVSITDGRISAATIVQVSAFAEAFVNIGTWADAEGEECPEGQHRMPDGTCMPDEEMQASGVQVFQEVTDQEWNGDASRFTPEQWRQSTILHREPEEGQDPLTKSLHSLPIREPDGTLNRNAVYAAAARINQVTDHTEEELAAAKRRLRSAYDTLGEEPPEVIQASATFQPQGDPSRGPGWVTHPEETARLHRYWTEGPGAAIINWGTPNDFYRCRRALAEYISPRFLSRTCAEWHHDALGVWPGQHNGETSTDPAVFVGTGLTAAAAESGLPPAEFFTNPQLTGPTAPIVDGRHYYGHLALWDTCHIGMQGACVTAPHSPTDYLYFATGVVQTDDGPVACGQITLGTGHAATNLKHPDALAHYDNTGTAVADVVVGEDEHGVWFSGALRHVSEETVSILQAASLSGDWRRIRGDLELVAALAVNVPGFPVPRTEARVQAGVQETLVAAGVPPLEAPVDLEQVKEDVRKLVLSDLSRMDRVAGLRREARMRKARKVRAQLQRKESDVGVR